MKNSGTEYKQRNLAIAMLLAAVLPFIAAGHLYLGTVSRALIFAGAIWGLGGLWALSLLFSVIVINDAFSNFFLFLAFAAVAAIIGTWVFEVMDARNTYMKLNAQAEK